MPESGIPEVRLIVQCPTQLEKETDTMNQRMKRFEVKFRSLFDDKDFVADKDGLLDRDKVGDIINDQNFIVYSLI